MQNVASKNQFNTVACREYTLPRKEEASQPKGWIQGNTKIGLVLEVATSYLHGKYGVEVRIMSLNRDNTHSWVRISHGSKKFVMNLNNNETEIPQDQLEEYASKLSAKDFACRSKAKAKYKEENLLALHQESFPLKEGIGSILSQENILSPNMRLSKKVTFLLCHSQQMHREEDGAIHFWRSSESIPTIYSLV